MKLPPDLQHVFAYFITQVISSVMCELTSEQCYSLGFNKANLLCSQCSELDDFNLQQLKPNCSRCCTADSGTSEARQYPRARLEVCG